MYLSRQEALLVEPPDEAHPKSPTEAITSNMDRNFMAVVIGQGILPGSRNFKTKIARFWQCLSLIASSRRGTVSAYLHKLTLKVALDISSKLTGSVGARRVPDHVPPGRSVVFNQHD